MPLWGCARTVWEDKGGKREEEQVHIERGKGDSDKGCAQSGNFVQEGRQHKYCFQTYEAVLKIQCVTMLARNILYTLWCLYITIYF